LHPPGIPGSRHIYLGLYSEERDAARAYDTALVRRQDDPTLHTQTLLADVVRDGDPKAPQLIIRRGMNE
jgi:hypothetical protein